MTHWLRVPMSMSFSPLLFHECLNYFGKQLSWSSTYLGDDQTKTRTGLSITLSGLKSQIHSKEIVKHLKFFLTLYKCFKWTMITVVKYFSCSITWKFQNANIHKAMQYFLLVASQTVALRHLTTLVNSCYFFKIPLKQALL